MADYVTLAATARRLIRANGAPRTLVKAGAVPADSSKPWRGADDPRGDDAETATAYALAVNPSGAASLGLKSISEDLLKRTSAILVFEAPLSGITDLRTVDFVRDGDGESRVTFVETLRPAAVDLLHFVGVAR